MLHVSRSAVSHAAGRFEEGSSIRFVIDLQIKQSLIGFALLKNILHYLIRSFNQQRCNQLPVLNIARDKLHLFDFHGNIKCSDELDVQSNLVM